MRICENGLSNVTFRWSDRSGIFVASSIIQYVVKSRHSYCELGRFYNCKFLKTLFFAASNGWNASLIYKRERYFSLPNINYFFVKIRRWRMFLFFIINSNRINKDILLCSAYTIFFFFFVKAYLMMHHFFQGLLITSYLLKRCSTLNSWAFLRYF